MDGLACCILFDCGVGGVSVVGDRGWGLGLVGLGYGICGIWTCLISWGWTWILVCDIIICVAVILALRLLWVVGLWASIKIFRYRRALCRILHRNILTWWSVLGVLRSLVIIRRGTLILSLICTCGFIRRCASLRWWICLICQSWWIRLCLCCVSLIRICSSRVLLPLTTLRLINSLILGNVLWC